MPADDAEVLAKKIEVGKLRKAAAANKNSLAFTPEARRVAGSSALEWELVRLEGYENQTAPLIQYYEVGGRLVSVSGTGAMDDVFGRICQALEARLEELRT